MPAYGRKTTAEEVSEGADLSGKNALVTGANTGIGLETARVLALRGANVTMACRDSGKAEAARHAIISEGNDRIDGNQLDILQLDLNSLPATEVAAKEFVSRDRPLHLLVNNAGIMIPMERRTAEGFEAHLGINHLGHFLFTNLLLAPLQAANGARVVVVSSAAMGFASLTHKFEDINWQARKFSGWKSYGDSKLMNLMFARELTLRCSGQGIVANALHPGVIRTELARDQSGAFAAFGMLAPPFMKSIPQGAATSVYLATAPEWASEGGKFFSNCKLSKAAHKLALNNSASKELWNISNSLCGTSFL